MAQPSLLSLEGSIFRHRSLGVLVLTGMFLKAPGPPYFLEALGNEDGGSGAECKLAIPLSDLESGVMELVFSPELIQENGNVLNAHDLLD